MTNQELIGQARKFSKLLSISSDKEAVELLDLLCERLEKSHKIAQKYIDLRNEIAKYYEYDEEEEQCNGSLLEIGEIAAIRLGFL